MISEELSIQKVAEQYENDGYEVHIRPGGAALPSFLGGFEPDIIAHKAAEHVVVEVKEQRHLAGDHSVAYLGSKVNAQPGWRFDLVVMPSDEWPDEITERSVERDATGIKALLNTARGLLILGQIEAACLIAWSALEAALRQSAQQNGIALESKSPQLVVRTLHTEGLMSRAEYDRTQDALQVRNALAHGLEVERVTGEIPTFLIELAERLLREAPLRSEGDLVSHSV